MFKHYIFFILSFFIYTLSDAQQIHRCYTDEYVNYLETKHPGIKSNIDYLYEQAKNQSPLNKSVSASGDTIFRIPVVFHVVYNASEENISDALLHSQIAVLNADYQRLNADTSNTRAIFKDRAAAIHFEFFLATIDPLGQPTTGITRTNTTKTSFSNGFFPSLDDLDEVKKTNTDGKDAWNTDEYLNIWVCNTGGALLGYAYPPLLAPNWNSNQMQNDANLWGVVISHEVIGFNNPMATGQLSIANKGRTAVHEIGHFLGLRHIWGDAGNIFGTADCDITKDDGIDDTPHMGNNSQITGCNFTKNSCTNGEVPDEPDMVENYMDYSTETCQNMFTKGQRNILENMIVIGRPQLAQIIKNETITLNVGDYVVINQTDTYQIESNTIISIQIGDEIMFLNANNAYNYTATNALNFNTTNGSINLSEEGNATFNMNTDISNIKTNVSFSISPNPSHSIINILCNAQYDKIQIQDLSGKIIFTANFQKEYHINYLNSGMYFVNLLKNNFVLASQKFIKAD